MFARSCIATPSPMVRRNTCVALALFVLAAACDAATFTVTTTADTAGSCTATPTNCTLRQAISSANSTVAADVINFNLAGTGVHVFAPATSLPTVTRGLTINGYSQPGSAANTSATGFNAAIKIQISGSAISTSRGLRIETAFGQVTVQGLSITGFDGQFGGATGTAIEAASVGTAIIRGCAIGASPTFAVDGNRVGIRITSDQTGAVTIGSEGDDAVAHANRNLIVDSTSSNILADAGTGAVNIFNNLIGTNAAGNSHLGTQPTGINILRPGAAIRGNTIKGSSSFGIVLQAANFSVTGNTIGRINGDLGGTVSNGVGIRIQGSAIGQGVIGGEGPLGNIIARSLGDAVEHAAADINVDMALNTMINGSGQRLIDLLGINGPETNDAGDGDAGPNGLQNTPLILSATRFVNENGTPITISGSLNSLPNRSFRINFYNNLGTLDDVSTGVTTDASGNASFGPLELVFPNENTVTIDATGTLLDAVTGLPVATSEYDDFGGTGVQTIPPPVPLIVNSTADPGNGVCDATECTLREAITTANGNGNQQSIDVISFAIPGTPGQAHTITLASPFQIITQPVMIDGYTQDGATPNTDATGVGSNAVLKIEIAGGPFHFFDLANNASGITLRGLSITGFLPPPIAGGLGFTAPNARVEGCWFGVRPDGSEVLGNIVVVMNSIGGVFGGDSPAQRNVWVNQRGLSLFSGRATNNLFGVLPDGRTAASISTFQFSGGNGTALFAVNPSASTLVDNNVFSTPVDVPAIIARNAQIIDNSFGESWDGTSTFSLGTAVRPSIDTVIRSTTKRIRNALNDAVVVDSSNLSGPIVLDQPIVGGQGRGVHHSFGSNLSVRSTISGTAGIGINLDGGIEDAAGVTPNDFHPTNGPDVDFGPNGLQNFPELISAFRGDNGLTVSGLLTSLPNTDYRIGICGNGTSHASGHGGCDEVLDAQTIITSDGDGLADFSVVVPSNPAHLFVTATASRIITADIDEQTSEFALNIPITAEPALFADSFE
jgi:CSLREA domain-containing protein